MKFEATRPASQEDVDPKAQHNAFSYRLSKAPPQVKSTWNAMKKSKNCNSQAIENFMETILTNKPGSLPTEFVEKCSRVVSQQSEGEEGAWVSWAAASRKEGGDDILEEMVAAGTVLTRRSRVINKYGASSGRSSSGAFVAASVGR